MDFNQAQMGRYEARIGWQNPSNAISMATSVGMRYSTGARNALMFFFSNGNIASGRFVLEGMRP